MWLARQTGSLATIVGNARSLDHMARQEIRLPRRSSRVGVFVGRQTQPNDLREEG